jgi:hypothetical protein
LALLSVYRQRNLFTAQDPDRAPLVVNALERTAYGWTWDVAGECLIWGGQANTIVQVGRSGCAQASHVAETGRPVVTVTMSDILTLPDGDPQSSR